MKTNPNIPKYVIDENGSVFMKSDGVNVPLEKGEYKLETSEVLNLMNGKTMTLIRRFTPDQIKKIYANPDSKILEDEPGKSVESLPAVEKSKKNGKRISISNETYESVSEAAKALKVSVNTIINRCKNEKFTDYKFL